VVKLYPAYGINIGTARRPVCQGIEKPFGFFDAKGWNFVRLKSSGISGRRTDNWCCFCTQYAYWVQKHIAGAHVAGND
jgi:hypothetical protein